MISICTAIHLRNAEGVVSYECRHLEQPRASLDAGHAFPLPPNHSRNADPLVLGRLCREMRCLLYAMASWHLFNQGRFTAWAIHKMGGFSVNRETIDRQAINTAIEILETAERPLVIFPEGAMTRTNDRRVCVAGRRRVYRPHRRQTPREAQRRHGRRASRRHQVSVSRRPAGDGRPGAQRNRIAIHLAEQSRRAVDRPHARIGQALLCLKEIEHFGMQAWSPQADLMG